MSGVMLIPAETPPLARDAHLTLVYAGENTSVSVLAQLRTLARMLCKQNRAFSARIMGVAMFGENHNEPVFLIEKTREIALMRSVLMRFDKSSYPTYQPHVAVPRLTRTYDQRKRPETLYFNKIALWVDDDGATNSTTWWLGS